MSNSNTIPNPTPHDNAIIKTELICRHKEGTNCRHTARTKYAVTKTELNNHLKDGC